MGSLAACMDAPDADTGLPYATTPAISASEVTTATARRMLDVGMSLFYTPDFRLANGRSRNCQRKPRVVEPVFPGTWSPLVALQNGP
jgi:hypothetical protein